MKSNRKDNPQTDKSPQKSKRKWIDTLLLVLIIACLGTAAYLLIKPMVVKHNQDKITAELNEALENGNRIFVDPLANKVPGEAYDFFGDTGEINFEDLPDQVELIPLGRLKIRKINVDLPILEGGTHVQLRYGLAHIEDTPLPGEPGNSSILGHRMLDNGRHLNRLNEVENGDTFTVNTGDDLYTYEVIDMPIIKPEELPAYIAKDYGAPAITLITCHPIPEWSHRLLCVGKQTRHQKMKEGNWVDVPLPEYIAPVQTSQE